MRFIPTAIHGVADYIVGVLVAVLPFYFGWTGSSLAIFVTLGAVAIIYSALTDYELGVAPYLSVRFHLILDAIFGLAMLLAPLLLSLPDHRALIYAIGAAALFLAITTKTRAGDTQPHSELRGGV